MISLCRNILKNIDCSHAGLLLSRGLTEYLSAEDKTAETAAAKTKIIRKICSLRVDDVYKKAFQRWQKITSSQARFSVFEARLAGRLYIGATRENALEAGISTHHVYGMPIIPGSAIKGLCRAYASWMEISPEFQRWIFGSTKEETAKCMLTNEPVQEEGGGIIFYDALWIPTPKDAKPFSPEIITAHHQDYYTTGGKTEASDFDSPIPNAQIAVKGSFYFVIAGEDSKGKILAASILKQALRNWGIGGKRSSGYGLFDSIKLPKVIPDSGKKGEETLPAGREDVLENDLATVSPIKKEMLAQGYNDQNTEKFKSKMHDWIKRMELESVESEEIAQLLKEWWLRTDVQNWNKGGNNKKNTEKIRAIKAFLKARQTEISS